MPERPWFYDVCQLAVAVPFRIGAVPEQCNLQPGGSKLVKYTHLFVFKPVLTIALEFQFRGCG